MRILHVDKFLRRQGGAASYMLDLGRTQVRHGHEVEYFAMAHPDNEPATYEALFPPFIAFDEAPSGVVGAITMTHTMVHSRRARDAMRTVVERFRPDVVHLHNIYHQLSPSILQPLRRAGIPAVMTVHDFKLVCPTYRMLDRNGPCDACVRKGFREAVIRRCNRGSLAASALVAVESSLHRMLGSYGHVSKFLAPSQFLADLLKRADVYPERVQVLPHGFGVDPKARPGGRDGSVVFVGRLSPEKGVDTAIRAIGMASTPSAHLHVLGSGPEERALRALAATEAPGRVTFHGHVGREAVLERLRTSSVAVLTARYYENQPMSILEAFACGVPVVGTDLGGIPELVDETTGRLVPPEDPVRVAVVLDALLQSPIVAERLGRNAQDRVATRHDPAVHLGALDDVYAKVTKP